MQNVNQVCEPEDILLGHQLLHQSPKFSTKDNDNTSIQSFFKKIHQILKPAK